MQSFHTLSASSVQCSWFLAPPGLHPRPGVKIRLYSILHRQHPFVSVVSSQGWLGYINPEPRPCSPAPSDPTSLQQQLLNVKPMPSLVIFNFTFTSSILNSVVVGPQARKYFQVMTDPADPRYTIFQNVDCNVAAFVEWQSHPIVDVRGIVESQQVSQWLSLSADKSYVHNASS